MSDELTKRYDHLIHTDARWFLSHAINGGFIFNVEGEQLSVTPANDIDEEMYSLIVKHRDEIVRLLTIHDDAEIEGIARQCHQEINDYRINHCE